MALKISAEALEASKPKGPGSAERMGAVEMATWRELRAAGRLDCSDGVEAMLLARALDHGGHTASGMAALAKARRDAMAQALKDAQPEADGVDELAAIRERLTKSA